MPKKEEPANRVRLKRVKALTKLNCSGRMRAAKEEAEEFALYSEV
jgi:hypothetical protein